jgi:tRNA(Leu) C34 or U34 (ribose-2'-O)-methylase TrmL
MHTAGIPRKEEKMMDGKTPAVILVNPRYDQNVGAAVRGCSAFGVNQLWVTGNRMTGEMSPKGKPRLPRELRMKEYGDVEVCYSDYPFDAYRAEAPRIVAVEIDPSAIPLTWFKHPQDAVYVFGPEDGSLSKVHKRFCTDFVYIPTRKDADGKNLCINLAASVNIILNDRIMSIERGNTE